MLASRSDSGTKRRLRARNEFGIFYNVTKIEFAFYNYGIGGMKIRSFIILVLFFLSVGSGFVLASENDRMIGGYPEGF